MTKKDERILEILQMIKYLKREEVALIDIIEVLKSKNTILPNMSEIEKQTFLSSFTDIPIEEFFYKNKFLEDFEFIFDMEDDFIYDVKSKSEKKKRYLN